MVGGEFDNQHSEVVYSFGHDDSFDSLKEAFGWGKGWGDCGRIQEYGGKHMCAATMAQEVEGRGVIWLRWGFP